MHRTNDRNTVSRRQLLLGAGTAGLALVAGCGRPPWQAPAPAAQPERPRRIGYLSSTSRETNAPTIEAFGQGLAEYGYVEGHNLTVDWRFADGQLERLPELAAELVALQPEAIVMPSGGDARSASQVTHATPLVVLGSGGDLVELQLATSLARPGGNVTGLSTPTSLHGKRMELLREAVPGLARMAVLRHVGSPILTDDALETWARTLGVQLLLLDVRAPEELANAFEVAASEQVEGLLVLAQSLFARYRTQVVALAAKHRLPALYGTRTIVDEGGLMSYGHRIADSHRRAASFVDRILKGASPADLPVEQPMLFDFVVNRTTGRTLGITWPESIVLQVTEVVD